MTLPLADLTAALLDAARKAGADAADALAVQGTSLSIDIRKGALEQAERAEGIDLGLRVLIGRRQACVASSDVRPATLAAMAERAVAMAREAPEDPFAGLAEPGQLARDWDIAALDLSDEASPDPAAAELEAAAREVEAAALSHAGIVQVEAQAGFSRRQMHIAASNGFDGGYGRTSRSVGASAFVGQGTAMEHDWAAESRIHAADMPDAAGIGHRAAERALSRLNPRRPPTGAFPVIYDERVASSLIGHLLAAVNGASVARGSSWLRDAIGQQVLPRGMSLIEDPLRPRAMSSRPFDAEGLACRRRAIVEDGILTGWTLDLATARKLGLASTANAARGASAPPQPSTTNIDLTQGPVSRDILMLGMGRGLVITSLIGSSVNPTTGDYSRGAFGFWVEDGEITGPVSECTVAGNLREMLATLVPANDARPHLSTRVPSLLVEGLTLAGG